MDFYEQCNTHLSELNDSEKKIFDFVIREINQVKDMSIRELSQACFTSTTSIFRFVKKLGFDGYKEFSNALRIADVQNREQKIPKIFANRQYGEEYLKNVLETVRVLSTRQLDLFLHALERKPKVFLLAEGLETAVALYAKQVFSALGYWVVQPTGAYEMRIALSQVDAGDLVFAFSYSGEGGDLVDFIEKAKGVKRAEVASITRANNNIIQSLSDIDFYIFTDELIVSGVDMTSRISMIAIVEMIAYAILQNQCNNVT